ncbi:MAG: archease [Candidatus Omnitrophota bacterium]|nr:archease [Candidatus Omnitrophota bacterium]
MKPYELIDHPADIGLKIHGRNLEEFFTNAAHGFTNLVTDLDALGQRTDAGRQSQEISLKAEDLSALFFTWLRELLYLFSAKNLVFSEYRFEHLSHCELKVRATGERFDPDYHSQKVEVKAVTYHQYSVKETAEGWQGQVIFDI